MMKQGQVLKTTLFNSSALLISQQRNTNGSAEKSMRSGLSRSVLQMHSQGNAFEYRALFEDGSP